MRDMKNIKVLIAGITNPVVSNTIKEQFEQNDCKVNIIGQLDNIEISVMLDRPDLVCIYFHTFTHNAIDVAKSLNNKFGIPTLFLIESDSFRQAVDICEDLNTLGCLKIPTSQEQIDDVVLMFRK